MADPTGSNRPTTAPGAGKSATRKWEEAASHRDRGEPAAEAGEPAGHDTGGHAAIDRDDPRRETFLNTRNGVFYPSGYAVLALEPEDASSLRDALVAGEFDRDDTLLLSPPEAAALMRQSDQEAGMLARIVGAEIRNARVMRQLAESGAALLVVRVSDDDAERSLVTTARRWRVRKALRYQPLAVRELPTGVEEVPGDSPYGVNEVLRSKPTEARLAPNKRASERRPGRK